MYLAQITAGSDDKEVLENKSKYPYKFLNFLGEKSLLIVSPSSILKPEYVIGFEFDNTSRLLTTNGEDSDSMYHSSLSINNMPVNKIEPVDTPKTLLKNTIISQVDTLFDEKFKFSLEIEGFEKVNLSLKTDGSYLIQLREIKKKNTLDMSSNAIELNQNNRNMIDMIKYNIMFRIRTNYGRAKIIFSSPLQIENKCKIKLLILVEMTNELSQMREKYDFKEVDMPDLNAFKEEHASSSNQMRKYAVLFELLPSKIFYVPLYFAYNCRIFTTPQNLKYAPSLIFDIKGYNLRKDDVKPITCKRLPNLPEQEFNCADNEKLLV